MESLISKNMEHVEGNGLATAGLVGKTIVRCDNQKCERCPNESFDCVKLIAVGGHVCIWE